MVNSSLFKASYKRLGSSQSSEYVGVDFCPSHKTRLWKVWLQNVLSVYSNKSQSSVLTNIESIMETLNKAEMLRPPINRALKQLDRSLFHKTVPLSVARVFDFKEIAKLRQVLIQDVLKVERRMDVVSLPQDNGQPGKGFLLHPNIKPDGIFWRSHSPW